MRINTTIIIHPYLVIVVLLLGIQFAYPRNATAATTGRCEEWAAKIVSIEGNVESRVAGEDAWQAVKLNDTYCPDDQVRTLEKSRAAIQLQNETVLRLDQNTMVRFSTIAPENPGLLELIRGSAFFTTRYPRPLTIETPYVNATSGGTEYHIEVNEKDKSATVTVIEGQMNVTNKAGSVTVKGGQAAVAREGQPPVLSIPVRPRDAIHWALYYPPVLNLGDLHLGGLKGLSQTDWRAMVQKSIEAYLNGDIAQAFAAIKDAPVDIPDPRFYAYRASLLLSVGRVDDAKADIDKAYALAPRGGLALALQSIIAVVQDEPDKALESALDAAEADPESVSVQIALSYAYQANFNLPQALAAAQRAVKLDAGASLAWARAAELWLAQDHQQQALAAAKEAAALNPRDGRIQTVLGFAYLTQINIQAAMEAFNKSISLNSADPLPRLGLGLARIRTGDLVAGRKEIEIAVTLDPGNALIRSYLGKAYYEERRDHRSETQFKLAEQLDPMDPTPYAYDAVRKQTINRPVEALHDVQSAIELNDNRAVYRSRLLLDSDLASRSVSRGRIYQTLGFDQLAVIDALESVNTDPMNYSAQRFLADSYATLPQSEIARQSALLTSQLLQPINNNPVQPGLSNDSVLSAETASLNPSFNEYSQLFDSNGIRLLASGIAGQENTFGDELTLNGVHNRYSWSLGQFHYKTDGFRDNADINQNIYDVYLQGQVTPKLGIQGEGRLNQENHGYLSLYYDPTIYSPTYDKDQTDRTYRLGIHYAPTPASSVLVSAFYQHHTESTSNSTPADTTLPPGFGYSAEGSQTSHLYEAQYLIHLNRVTLITGAGYYTAPSEVTTNAYINVPGLGNLPLPSGPPIPDKTRHANLYLYSLVNMPKGLQLTIGGSADSAQDTTLGNHKQFNPKLGLIWDINPATKLRLVGLRTLNRNFVSNQTIEPTQVAGFQQFFQDLITADSKLYGIGLDHKFSAKIFSGLEFTDRDVKTPKVISNTAEHYTIKYHRGRAYLYWTPDSRIAASADYYYERSEDDPLSSGAKTTTQRIPLGIKYFHPSGFFAGMTVSYVDQSGNYDNPATQTLDPVSSQFWLVDGSVGYRLPRRRGIISVGVHNLTDRQFRMNEVDPQFHDQNQLAPLQPRRFVFAKLTLSFD